MASYTPSAKSAVETIERFNIPSKPLLRPSGERRLLQLQQSETITPTIYLIRGKNRTWFKIRNTRELQDLALGGDIEYLRGDRIEVAWTNDQIRLELLLVPRNVSATQITFSGEGVVYHKRSELILLSEIPSATFYLDKDLLVPQEVLDTLESHKYH